MTAMFPSNAGRPFARTGLWLLLGGWFGSFLFFGAVIAPTAFSVLPSSEVAGTLVGPVLEKLQLFGAGAGIPIALLSNRLGRPRWLSAVPLLLSAGCLYSHCVLSAEMAEIRDLAFGSGASAEVAVRYGRLHAESQGIFIGVGIVITALVGLHAWADARSVKASG